MILMYNEKTEEVRTTVASVTGKVFIGYVNYPRTEDSWASWAE